MFVGEDVDFVWRMSAAGWRVRYEPDAVMGHQHRVLLRSWFARRADYGTSAAALEQLHPGAVRPLYASWWTVAAWAAAFSRRPGLAVALTGTATALLARRLSRVTGERWPLPTATATATTLPLPLPPASQPPPVLITARGAGARRGCSPCASREAGPWRPGGRWAAPCPAPGGRLAIPAAVYVRRLRLPVTALILAPPLLDWADRRPPLDPARYVAARLLDDAAYSLGVWQGCADRRTIRPLLPAIGSGPGHGKGPAGRR